MELWMRLRTDYRKRKPIRIASMMKLVLSVLLTSLLAPQVQAQDANAVMQKMIATYQTLSSYEGQANALESMQTPSNIKVNSLASNVKMFYSKPNRLALQFSTRQGGLEVYSDGAQFTAFSAATRTYFTEPTAPNLKEMLKLINRAAIAAALDPLYFMSVGKIPSNVTNLKMLPSAKINDRPCFVVSAKSTNQIRDPKNPKVTRTTVSYWTWWIDKQTNTLNRIETKIPGVKKIMIREVNKKRVQQPVTVTVIVRQTITNVKLNGNISDSNFKFTVPPDAIKAKTTDEILSGK